MGICKNCMYFSTKTVESEISITKHRGLTVTKTMEDYLRETGECLFAPPHLWCFDKLKGHIAPNTKTYNVCSEFKQK